MSKCKVCRRAGEKLFLKGERCYTPKCAVVRKPFPPGIHGRGLKRSRRSVSEYGTQLREKQELKFLYGMRETQFKNYVKKAIDTQGIDTAEKLIQLLETRLDNVVFRSGLALSRSIANQLVGHGHIMVNGRKIDIPSHNVRKGDVVSIRPQSASKGVFKNLDIYLKKYQPPQWLKVSKEKKECEIVGLPILEQVGINTNINLIIEFYSR